MLKWKKLKTIADTLESGKMSGGPRWMCCTNNLLALNSNPCLSGQDSIILYLFTHNRIGVLRKRRLFRSFSIILVEFCKVELAVKLSRANKSTHRLLFKKGVCSYG